jgi:hypothetical protein
MVGGPTGTLVGAGIGGGLGLLAGLGEPTSSPYGITTGHFQPYSTGGGIQTPAYDTLAGTRFGHAQQGGGDLVRAPQGMDQTSPGFGEQFFYQNQGNYYGGAQLGGNAYAQNQSAYGAPGVGEQYWQGVAGNQNRQQLGNVAFEGLWGQQPGGQSGQVNQYAQSQLVGQGGVGAYAGANMNAFSAPQASQAMYLQGQAQLSGPSQSQLYAQQAMPGMQGPTASQQYFQTAMPGMQERPENSQQVFNQFQSRPSGMGAYYDHAATQATEDINRALAAQGLMGSSYGAAEMGTALAGLRAEQAQREGDYYLREQQLAGQLAQGADRGFLDSYLAGGQLAQMADQSGLQQTLGGAQLAGQADQQQLARAMGLGELGQASDQERLAYLMGGGQLAQMGSQEQLARLGLMGQLGGQADQQMLDFYGLAGNMGSQVDQQQLAMDLGYGNLALGAQGMELDRAGMGFNQGLQLDQFGLQQTNQGMEAALAAQMAYENRGQQQFNNTMDLSNALALQAQQAYQQMLMADQQNMDAALAAESGLALQAVLNSQRQQQQNEQGMMGMFGMLGDVGSAGGFSNLFTGAFK